MDEQRLAQIEATLKATTDKSVVRETGWTAAATDADKTMVRRARQDLTDLTREVRVLQTRMLALYQELWGAYHAAFPEFATRQLAERYPDLAQMWEAQKQQYEALWEVRGG